jgi:uncharacterized protein (TIGR01589 family)
MNTTKEEKKYSYETIKTVHKLIESCVKKYMTQNETINFLSQLYSNVDPSLVSLS